MVTCKSRCSKYDKPDPTTFIFFAIVFQKRKKKYFVGVATPIIIFPHFDKKFGPKKKYKGKNH